MQIFGLAINVCILSVPSAPFLLIPSSNGLAARGDPDKD